MEGSLSLSASEPSSIPVTVAMIQSTIFKNLSKNVQNVLLLTGNLSASKREFNHEKVSRRNDLKESSTRVV